MKKLMLLSVLLFSSASAYAFDWSLLVKYATLNGVQLNISKKLYTERDDVASFCATFNMKIASLQTLKKAAVAATPPVKEAIFTAHYNSGKVTGIWGWSDEQPVKIENDTKVTLLYDGNAETPIPTTLPIVNSDLANNGLLPYKGLPAICEPK